MSVVITTAVVVGLALWAVAIYNRLVRLKQQVRTAWNLVDVQLARRRDLVPALVTVMQEATSFEPGLLEALVAARDRAVKPRGPVDAAAKDAALMQAIGRGLRAIETYPRLAAGAEVRDLRSHVAAAEDAIAAASTSYNQIATAYNTAIQVVPNNFVAGLGGFPRAEPFQPNDTAPGARH
jgi:LemA protein